MAEIKTNSEVQTTQEDPKLQQYNDKINDIQTKIDALDDISRLKTDTGAFNIGYVLNDSFKDTAIKAFKKAEELRKTEECEPESLTYCTYVKIVLDPEKVYSLSPKEWKAEDIVYLRYTDDYSSEDKAKEKISDSGVPGLDGKTPMKIYKTVSRELKASKEYKDVEKLIKNGRKAYKKYLDVIDDFEDLTDKKQSLEAERKEYIETKKTKKDKEKEAKQQAKDSKREVKTISEIIDKLEDFTVGPKAVMARDTNKFFAAQYTGTQDILKEYSKMGLLNDGETVKKQKEEYNKLKETLAPKVIEEAEKTLANFKEAVKTDKKAKPDYTAVKSAYDKYMEVSKPLFEGINAKKKEAVSNAKKSAKEERKKAKSKKGETDKKEFADNINPKTIQRLEELDTTGKGGLDGAQTSPEATTAAGDISKAQTTEALSDATVKSDKEEKKTPVKKYEDDNKWTDENIQKIQSKKSGLTEKQQQDATTDIGTVLATVSKNLVGAVVTNPALVGNINGMISSGTFNAQSIEGLGNAMLSDAVGTLTNALANTPGIESVDKAVDNAISATATIVTTATNIVPTIKELTTATVTTVSDELTNHVTTRVTGILDPSAINSQMTYFMSYYTKIYTQSADDLKKKLLSPGDAAISDSLNAKNEENKNAKMTNMTSKITELKNKSKDVVETTKSGITMVTTYINNGPDWVIKQLNTYTNFVISQTEKYIDYGADYVEEKRDMYIAMGGEYLGKLAAEKANMIQEQVIKKSLDYIEVKKKYATQVAMAAIMTAVQMVVSKLGPTVGIGLKAGVKLGMKQLLKTIGG